MSHALHVNSEPVALREVTDIGRADNGALLLRLHRLDGARLALIASGGATCNGVPLLGNLGLLGWGDSALVRTGELRVEIVWQRCSERRVAPPGSRCRVCFGAFAAGELARLCACEAVLHDDCHGVLVSCPSCGAPPQREEQ